MKPFVIKALPHETGKANKKTFAMLNGIIKELFNDELPISLQYKAVDGDPGYNKEFDFEFTFLFEYFSKHEIEGLFQLIDRLKEKYSNDKRCLILTDMVSSNILCALVHRITTDKDFLVSQYQEPSSQKN